MKPEEIITDRIVKLLENGTVPWHKPWSGKDQMPRNGISKREYRGVNVWMLHAQSYSSPDWITYKEAKARGGYVKAGEHGTPVILWKWISKPGEAEWVSEEKSFPMLRYYTVFNLEQCENVKLPGKEEVAPEPVKEFTPIEECERIYHNMPNKPALEHGKSIGALEAYYNRSSDLVVMPKPESFDSAEFYYSVLFHELTHSTGNATRLNRSTLNQALRFGDTNYSREELVAEMGAAFLSGITGIEQTTLDNSAAYVASWIQALKGDAKLVIVAAAQAQKAADFILNRQSQA